MFRCKVNTVVFNSHNKGLRYEEQSGFYIEAIMYKETPSAVVLIDTKLQTVPLSAVTWTGWVE